MKGFSFDSLNHKEMEAIAKNLQDEIDVRMVDLKDDEASVEGTQAVRLLVQKLHEAQGNSSLQPVVQALMQANNNGYFS